MEVIAREPGCQRAGRDLGAFRGRAVHHDLNGVVLLRKGAVVVQLVLPPGRLLRQQIFAVGVDLEVFGRMERRDRAKRDRQQHHQPGGAAGGADNGGHDG